MRILAAILLFTLNLSAQKIVYQGSAEKRTAATKVVSVNTGTPYTYHGKSFWQYGAVPDDGLPDTAAMSAFIADLDTGGNRMLYVPAGKYLMPGYTVEIPSNENVYIMGEGVMHTIFEFSGETPNIAMFNMYGGWSWIEGVKIQYVGTTGSNINGIWNHGHANRFTRVWVDNAPSVAINTSTGPGNGNNLYYEHCIATNSAVGLRTGGTDSNAGMIVSGHAEGNQYGHSEESFLGNYWFGCTARDNTVNDYRVTDVNGRSVFVGCMGLNSVGGTNSVNMRSMTIGGHFNNGMDGTGAYISAENEETVFDGPVYGSGSIEVSDIKMVYKKADSLAVDGEWGLTELDTNTIVWFQNPYRTGYAGATVVDSSGSKVVRYFGSFGDP